MLHVSLPLITQENTSALPPRLASQTHTAKRHTQKKINQYISSSQACLIHCTFLLFFIFPPSLTPSLLPSLHSLPSSCPPLPHLLLFASLFPSLLFFSLLHPPLLSLFNPVLSFRSMRQRARPALSSGSTSCSIEWA